MKKFVLAVSMIPFLCLMTPVKHISAYAAINTTANELLYIHDNNIINTLSRDRTLGARAKIGDVIQPIYSTDIITMVDGVPIQSYAIDGRTMIALEDLCNYGFTVNYVDSLRTVYIYKTDEVPSEYSPDIPRGRVGEISGYTLVTDIKAYVNGSFIRTQAIDGKVVAVVEELGSEITEENDDLSVYGMTYTYDNDTRTLYLFTSIDKANDKSLYLKPYSDE